MVLCTIAISVFNQQDQVLRNLLSNALKFSHRGSVVTVRAAFQSGKAVERVETKITANSPGFFERMFQLWYPSQPVADHDHDGDPPPPPPQTHQKQHQVVEGIGGRHCEIQGELVIVVIDAGAGQSYLLPLPYPTLTYRIPHLTRPLSLP